MTTYPRVRFMFQYEQASRFPGESGILGQDIVEFLDRDGKMLRFERKIRAAAVRAGTAFLKALESKGFVQWLSFEAVRLYERKQRRLSEEARAHVVRLLAGPPRTIELKMCRQTASSRYYYIESGTEAAGLEQRLLCATELVFIIVKRP